jgi:hypothetical protein
VSVDPSTRAGGFGCGGGRRPFAAAAALATCLAASLAACERPAGAAPAAPGDPAAAKFPAPPARDRVMGGLSGVARHVAAGLQDPAVRAAVARALLAAPDGLTQLDLQDCARSAVVKALFEAGERRGGGSAAALCAVVERGEGMVLYMDRDALARWDARAAPVVTAVADVGAPMPATFRGYAAPERTVDLPGDGAATGPVLVVLPGAHPRRPAARSHPSAVVSVERPDPPPGRQAAPLR